MNNTLINSGRPEINWLEIDTVLVDMDGTLLDLAFDTRFWLRTLPTHIAQQRQWTFDQALAHVMEHGNQTKGTLKWYCIDHWSDRMSVDIRALKHAQRHLIRWLPGAQGFVQALARLPAKKWLATNAHPFILSLKQNQLAVQTGFDRAVTCHEFDAPKESASYWSSMVKNYGLDPSRAVLIDDSVNVLEAAAAAGIAYPIEVMDPDSEFGKGTTQPVDDDRIFEIQGVAELTDSIIQQLS